MDEINPSVQGCGFKDGRLPVCAPLAVSYVPSQSSVEPRYEPDKALYRGTVFPGLDLPLGNIVNKGTAATPLRNLMSLDFACHDLSLYLDSHPDDSDAFAVYRELLRLSESSQMQYTSQHGPISKSDLANESNYTWLNGPWPWECNCDREG